MGIFLPVYLIVVFLAPSYKRREPSAQCFCARCHCGGNRRNCGRGSGSCPTLGLRSAYSSNLCCQSCRTLSLENSRANSYRGCRYRRFSVAPCVKGGHIRGFTGLMQSSERHSRPTILGVLAGMESEVVVGNIHGSGGLNSMDIAGNYFAVSARWGRELIGEGFSQPLASQKYGVADLCAWDICGIWRKQHSVADFCLLRQGWNVRVRKRARSCALSLWRSGARPSLAD